MNILELAAICFGLLVVAIIIGVCQTYLTDELRLKKRYNDNLARYFSILSGIVIVVYLFIRSFAIFTLWVKDPTKTSAWTILVPVAILISGVCVMVITNIISKISSWAQVGHLVEYRSKTK